MYVSGPIGFQSCPGHFSVCTVARLCEHVVDVSDGSNMDEARSQCKHTRTHAHTITTGRDKATATTTATDPRDLSRPAMNSKVVL